MGWKEDEEPATGTRRVVFVTGRPLGQEEMFDLQEYIERILKGVQDVDVKRGERESLVIVQIHGPGVGDLDMQVVSDELVKVVETEVSIVEDETL